MPTYRCRKTRRAPALDGRIDRTVWDQAEPASLVLTHTGKPPKQATEVRMLYDDRFLYVAFHCIDSDVWAALPHHDDPICREEVVEIFIDPTRGQRSYIEIEVSPHNVVYDLYVLNDARSPKVRVLAEWDCLDLRTAVHIEREMTPKGRRSKYWNCEMAIPFHQMHDAPNLPPKPGDQWRLNLYRIDRAPRRDEYSAFSPTGVLNFHRPDKFGEVVFLDK